MSYKAENLTISIPNNGCNKNCNYCISKMTGYIDKNIINFKCNIPKVVYFAKNAQVSNVLLTGKGEPLLDIGSVFSVLSSFIDFPLEIQTNGLCLIENLGLIEKLKRDGLNTISFSLDNIHDFEKFKEVFNHCNKNSLNIRVTFNVLDTCTTSFDYFISKCKTYNVNQLTFRKITIPNKTLNNTLSFNTSSWIFDNVKGIQYDRLIKEALTYIRVNKCPLIRKMLNGMNIYDIDDIAFSYSEYCIQETCNEDSIRSLIYMEDGHLYTAWNSKASIIF